MAGYTFSSPTDFKIIILFIIGSFGEAVENSAVIDVFMEREFSDYFTLRTCVDELIRAGLLEEFDDGGGVKYLLTDIGKEAVDGFGGKIPKTVRKAILGSVKEYIRRKENGLNVTGYYRRYNELEHMAELSITEGGAPLLSISINCGDGKMAREVCRKFKADPQRAYEQILDILT